MEGIWHRVIEQISVKNKNKKLSFCKLREPNDPLTVLSSRGLINIENTPTDSNSPASEVDLTLYTEESRVGDVVKVFSSTHRFKNGRLVYSTTQEACPELDEEIDKFNRWWKSHESGRSKNIDEKEPSHRYKHTKKKLSDIFKDVQKQEIVRRYEMARNNSSDNTSVCTIFCKANGDWINEKQDPYLCQKHEDQERCHYKNHNKILELIPYPSSPKITNKCRTRDCRRDCCYSRNCCTDDILGNNLKCFTKCHKNHKTLDLIPYISSPKMSNKCLPRDCPRMCCYSRNFNTDESLENNIKCFAKCHKKHQGDHEVSIMTGIVSNHKEWGLPNEKYEAIKVIESFMNERALDEFGKRCGNAIDESNRKSLSTAASEQFCKEIEKRRKIETRVRK